MCVFQRGHGDDDIHNNNNNNKNLITTGRTSKNASTNEVYTATTSIKNGAPPLSLSQLDFEVKIADLRAIMDLKGVEAKHKLDECFGSVELLASKLRTDLQHGISGVKEDLASRVRQYGKNEIPPKPPKSFLKLALEAVQDTTLIMLIVCAVISISLSFYHPTAEVIDEEFGNVAASKEANLEWVEGAAIMIAVVVVVFVTAFNDWRKERQFRGLQDRIESDHLASVVRGAKIVQINVRDLVVGDICCIR